MYSMKLATTIALLRHQEHPLLLITKNGRQNARRRPDLLLAHSRSQSEPVKRPDRVKTIPNRAQQYMMKDLLDTTGPLIEK